MKSSIPLPAVCGVAQAATSIPQKCSLTITKFFAPCFLSMVSSVALADTVTALPAPHAPSALYNVHWGRCAATAFGKAQILGTCQYNYGSCSGRNCRTPSAFYYVTWTFAGNPTLGASCTANCTTNFQGTGDVVAENGAYYYYVAADSIGDELVCQFPTCYLVTP